MKKINYYILGVVVLILTLTVDTLNQVICSLLTAIFAGLASGYLACRVKPQPDYGHAALQGLKIGLLVGLFSLGGHLLSGFISEALQKQKPNFAADLGIQTNLFGLVGSSFCSGIFELIIYLGAGALGGIFYTRSRKTDPYQRPNKK